MVASSSLFARRDADDAVFLGSTNRYDVYTSHDGFEAILQFGDDESQYRCLPWAVVKGLDDLDYQAALRVGLANCAAATVDLLI